VDRPKWTTLTPLTVDHTPPVQLGTLAEVDTILAKALDKLQSAKKFQQFESATMVRTVSDNMFDLRIPIST